MDYLSLGLIALLTGVCSHVRHALACDQTRTFVTGRSSVSVVLTIEFRGQLRASRLFLVPSDRAVSMLGKGDVQGSSINGQAPQVSRERPDPNLRFVPPHMPSPSLSLFGLILPEIHYRAHPYMPVKMRNECLLCSLLILGTYHARSPLDRDARLGCAHKTGPREGFYFVTVQASRCVTAATDRAHWQTARILLRMRCQTGRHYRRHGSTN